MDLAQPLRSLIPSLDADVLAVLAGTESALGASQLARLSARGSRQGISLVLDRLVEHGLVLAQPTNVGHVYRLNRDHLLAPALLAGLQARPRLRTLLHDQVVALKPRPVHASIFGSFARGEGGPASDIDLFLVVEDALDVHGPAWATQLQALGERVLRVSGNRLEPLVLTRSALRDAATSGEPIVSSLTAEADTVHGPAMPDLLATAVAR